MTKREMVIIGLAVAALLYVIKSFIFSSTGSGVEDLKINPEELNRFVTDTIQNTKSVQPSELDAYVLAQAESEWKGNPFLESESLILAEQGDKPAGASDKPNETMEITYSGYIESMGKRLAIINGSEYEEGETMDTIGFVVVNITPDMVVIEEEKTKKKGEKSQIILPMEEIYVFQLENPNPKK
jgi:hypothetical protein